MIKKILRNLLFYMALLTISICCSGIKVAKSEDTIVHIISDTIPLNFSSLDMPSQNTSFDILNVAKIDNMYYFCILLEKKHKPGQTGYRVIYNFLADALGDVVYVFPTTKTSDYDSVNYSTTTLFAYNNKIWLEDCYHGTFAYFDVKRKKWVESEKTIDENVVFENEKYKVIYYEFNGWCGGCTWFVDKTTGKEHITYGSNIVNFANNKFYFTTIDEIYSAGYYIVEEIENPEALTICDDWNSYYDKRGKSRDVEYLACRLAIKQDGVKTIFEKRAKHATFINFNNYLMQRDFAIYTSFTANNHLLHICSQDKDFFVGEISTGEMHKVARLPSKIIIGDLGHIGNFSENPRFLEVVADVKNTKCIMEIDKNVIYYHYIKPYQKNEY